MSENQQSKLDSARAAVIEAAKVFHEGGPTLHPDCGCNHCRLGKALRRLAEVEGE